MLESGARKRLSDALFNDPDLRTYAILDGARNIDLLPKLNSLGLRAECLFPGAVEQEVLSTAPHLAPVRDGDELFQWIVSGGAGTAWGVFLIARAEVLHVAAHLRGLSIAVLPGGRFGYLRYYDPRVLQRLHPTFDARQREKLYGRIVERFVTAEGAGEDSTVVVFDKGTDCG